jgi:hypothetical protein
VVRRVPAGEKPDTQGRADCATANGADPYLLTELSNNPALRALAQLGSIGGRTVLLVPEEQAAARRQLKKLGYIPRKGS